MAAAYSGCSACSKVSLSLWTNSASIASRLSASYGDIKELMLGYYSGAVWLDLQEWFEEKATALEVAGFVAKTVQNLSRADAARVYAFAHDLFMADALSPVEKDNA